MSYAPRLSVLMSAYNAEPFLKEAIDSILGQSMTDLELIVADDGSNDRTRAILDGYEGDNRVMISHNTDNMGKVATINRLYALSTGEFITVHDGDDTSELNRFEVQLQEFQKVPTLIMCGSWFNYVDLQGHFMSECQSIANYEEILANIGGRSVFHGPTTVFRRSVIEKLGELFRPFFDGYHEDADLNIRLSEMGECYNIPQVLYQYRVVPGSLSKQFTPRKLVLYKVVAYLAEQRAKNGMDQLQQGEEAAVSAFLEQQLSSYDSNPSLFHHDAAGKLLQFDLTWDAVRQALLAVRQEPWRLKNYRLLQYCLRMKLTRG